MKIGVISDNHQKLDLLKQTLDFLVQNGAEFIIHAGDVCRYEALSLLEQTGLRYIVVYGNNDAALVKYHNDFNLVEEPYYFKLAETKFKLMHLPFYMTPDTDIVISGHTHIFACEFKNNTLFLNPGEVCAREKPLSECVMLEINNTSINVEYFTNLNSTKKFNFQKSIL